MSEQPGTYSGKSDDVRLIAAVNDAKAAIKKMMAEFLEAEATVDQLGMSIEALRVIECLGNTLGRPLTDPIPLRDSQFPRSDAIQNVGSLIAVHGRPLPAPIQPEARRDELLAGLHQLRAGMQEIFSNMEGMVAEFGAAVTVLRARPNPDEIRTLTLPERLRGQVVEEDQSNSSPEAELACQGSAAERD